MTLKFSAHESCEMTQYLFVYTGTRARINGVRYMIRGMDDYRVFGWKDADMDRWPVPVYEIPWADIKSYESKDIQKQLRLRQFLVIKVNDVDYDVVSCTEECLVVRPVDNEGEPNGEPEKTFKWDDVTSLYIY
jgi:hypothetical protein